MVSSSFRTGFISIVGRPNVGKSTLLNALTGKKVSIVSNKTQTTRDRIQGILTRQYEQFIFVDTPGFQTQNFSNINRSMNRFVTQSLTNISLILYVVEAGKWKNEDKQLLDLLPLQKNVFLIINKVDKLNNYNILFPFVTKIKNLYAFEAVIPVSAHKNQQLGGLLEEAKKYLPEKAPIFGKNDYTCHSTKFIASEFVREKIFRLVGDEVPYCCSVVIKNWEETPKETYIIFSIVVRQESHRPILLGRAGTRIKRISIEARQDLIRLLNKPVHCKIYVSVDRKR